jgi:hypothetical protein
MNDQLYTSVIYAKTGTAVPVFKTGHAMHSRYDPVHEAELIVRDIPENIRFFVLAGFGGGYIASALLRKQPDCRILAAEQSTADISFLKKLPIPAMLMNDERISVFPVQNTAQFVRTIYFPAVYGNMQILEQRSWIQENPEGAVLFRQQIQEVSQLISADYSAQVHFGYIWQRNILCNLRQADRQVQVSVATGKTALIAAAGPSLDHTAEYIKINRNTLYIIATDTAYASFCRKGIFCDAVVSIDGQAISHMHFFSYPEKKPLFIFDLCADPSSVRTVKKHGAKVFFAVTGHPLAAYAQLADKSSIHNSFLTLESGAGTVTIAAADFARQVGFRQIVIAGADFAYSDGKPYMQGTYLDSLYYGNACRISTAEQNYGKLLYRTSLICIDPKKRKNTTAVLDVYRLSLQEWFSHHSFSFSYCNDLWHSNSSDTTTAPPYTILSSSPFDFPSFCRILNADISRETSITTTTFFSFSPIEYAVMPFTAYLRNKIFSAKPCPDFSKLLKLAYSQLLRYTKNI